ncbi:MAG: hypothetical protein AUK34_05025 [Ignavibacteria bacterium CG2_30_36_16]|nr:MAG: hypothetical protein AUK34_05025 [Ignavibacteria bacterium CG2_30_36_16]
MRRFLIALLLTLFVSCHALSQFSTKWDTVYSGGISGFLVTKSGKCLISNEQGIIISTDEGNTWNAISNNSFSLIVEGQNSFYASNQDYKLYRSSDEGATWILCSLIINDVITSIAADEAGSILVGTSGGVVYKSTDEGNNWNMVYQSSYYGGIQKTAIDPLGNYFVAVSATGIFKSSNGGNAWLPLFTGGHLDYSIDIAFDQNNNIHFTHESGYYCYDQNGTTIRHIDLWYGFISVSIDSNNNFYIGFDKFYKSTNEGYTWGTIKNAAEYYSFNNKIRSSANFIFIFGDYSLLRYDAGGEVPENYIGTNYLPLKTGNQWLYLNHFSIWIGPSGIKLKKASVTKDSLINYKKYFYLDTIGWINYSESAKTITMWQDSAEKKVIDFSYPPGTLYPLDNYVEASSRIFNIFGSDRKAKGYYSFPSVEYIEGIGKTLEVKVRDWSWDTTKLIQCILYDSLGTPVLYDYPYDPQIIYEPAALASDSVHEMNMTINHYYSYPPRSFSFIDSVWIKGYYIKGNDTIPLLNTYGFNVTGTNNFRIVLNTDLLRNGYILRYRLITRDKGIVPHYVSEPSDDEFYILKWDPTINVHDGNERELSFGLEQNYPNPFNPATKIKFTLPSPFEGEGRGVRLATLKVYDVLGREIKTLINKELSPGSHDVNFDGRNLTSGVYFYRLDAGSFSQTKKMILMR